MSGTFKRSINWRNRSTISPKIALPIATVHGYLLGDLLFDNKFFIILYSIEGGGGHGCDASISEMLPLVSCTNISNFMLLIQYV